MISNRGILLVYTLTIFVSSSLLFIVQPMFAKMVLPLLGGAPQVWNTSMLFFQAALLLGYVYTHLSIRWLGLRQQVWLHLGLLVLPLFVLPIALDPNLVPDVDVYPAFWLLGVLTLTVGLPFTVVASYGPMLQKWFSEMNHSHSRDPYFLYAASNTGSMVALLSYPFLIEPVLALEAQSRLWSIGYGLLLVLTFICARALLKSSRQAKPVFEQEVIPEQNAQLSWSMRLRWIALAFVPSSMMLGVTSYISIDIAAVPLLWVVPLALYLLSFTLVFARYQLLPHQFFLKALPFAAMILALLLAARIVDPMPVIVILHLAVFFIIAMACHGELAKNRPSVSRLTEFYLLLSVGGVLGGIFNALVSPLVFNDIFEYPITLFIALLLCPTVAWSQINKTNRFYRYALIALPALLVLGIDAVLNPLMQIFGIDVSSLGPLRLLLVIILPLVICYVLLDKTASFAFVLGGWFIASMVLFEQTKGDVYFSERSYFGVNEISVTPKMGDAWVLRNGVTIHGVQQRQASLKNIPGTYYHPTGPVGQVFASYENQTGAIGVIGLGAGSIASYAQKGNVFDFFEIDPIVASIAEDQRYFSYLQDARIRGAEVNVLLGDARLVLKNQADNKYDLLVIDAFSSDAIPVHLATREAVEIYLQKTRRGGPLLFHVSNRYLEMRPVLCNIADELNLQCYHQENSVNSKQERRELKFYSQWVLMGTDEALRSVLNSRWKLLPRNDAYPVWRDDYSNILQILK